MSQMSGAPILQEIDSDILMNWGMIRPKQFLVQRKGFDANYVDAMEREYKRFMALTLMYPGKLIPISEQVDEMWHAHILFTHNYRKMGETLAGGYIHHIPAATQQECEALLPHYFANTLPLYEQHFGPPDEAYWPRSCVCSPGCGGTLQEE